MPRIVEPGDAAIAQAAKLLRSGEVVAFPTETVYGLGAATFNAAAIEKIYALKGRPGDNPLIAHVSDAAQVKRIADGWDARCEKLAEMFWPGPLTLVLPRRDDVPTNATAGLPTIAVRCPAHAVAQALLRAFGEPVSAPSANRSGHVSPTTAQHVADDFADDAALLILDGGPCDIGIESTVLDMSSDPPRILRPGSVTIESLARILGNVAAVESSAQAASPGTTLAHYRPNIPAQLCSREELLQTLQSSKVRAVALLINPEIAEFLSLERKAKDVPASLIYGMPNEPAQYAALLYDALRDAERSGAARILIERVPDDPAWEAVRDRLRRATS